MTPGLVRLSPQGLYCPAGDFHIDPWSPVPRALITHAHGDHARAGSQQYFTATAGVPLVAKRLGTQAPIDGMAYGERRQFAGVEVSFHPAGHILGSSQVRIQADSGTWVVSGDYKRDPDPTCAPFEVLACDTFISEATFALPIYRWRPPSEVAREIFQWWQVNRAAGLASVLFCYALGKAQRVLTELAAFTRETVYVHGAVDALLPMYRDAGVQMLPTEAMSEAGRDARRECWREALILAPPSAAGSAWMRRFTPCATGFCSGWMRVRGQRRRRGYDRGFVLSDHADWPSLLATFQDTGATRVLLTHGQSDAMVRYLRERGADADA
ncbi:MAG: ligase-associated DNA damage response exonuclease, partial [Steroidobacteraceae bacterium]